MKKLLFIEDDEVIGRIYSKKLRLGGFKVDWVKTVDEAVKAFNGRKYDVVALDNTLEGTVTGMDIIPDIRKQLPSAIIIMLSNNSQFQMKNKTLKAGADEYLVKLNTTPESLIKTINSLKR